MCQLRIFTTEAMAAGVIGKCEVKYNIIMNEI